MEKYDVISQLLHKFYVEGENISTDELRELSSLLSDKREDGSMADFMNERWRALSPEIRDVDYNKIFKKIEQTIDKKTAGKRNLTQRIQRYAAIMLLPLIGLSCFLLVKAANTSKVNIVEERVLIPVEQEYYTPPGLQSKVMLSDGTNVWLNASSQLVVKEGFGAKSRSVELTGEAYFEVVGNEELPFVVNTSDMELKVIGTSFNVSAYPDSKVMEAVLIEGNVEVFPKNKKGKHLKELQMLPDQLIRLDKESSKITLVNDVETDIYTSWTHGLLMFRKTPMEEVARILERRFNVTIELHDKSLKNHTYTGTFDNRTIDQIMGYIALSSAITYQKDKDRITLYAKKDN